MDTDDGVSAIMKMCMSGRGAVYVGARHLLFARKKYLR